MHDIIFIDPCTENKATHESHGTMLLATILRKNEYDASILRFHRFGDIRDFEAFLSRGLSMILDEQPKIVSFYTRCDIYHIELLFAAELKARRPELIIVFGGPMSIQESAEKTLLFFPDVDYICGGEGESTVVPFFSSLLAGSPDLSVPGLIYRAGDGGTRVNPLPPYLDNLDELPIIDFSLSDAGTSSVYNIEAGRGCPFACTYCGSQYFWNRRFRMKSADRILREIALVKERYGIEAINFTHDLFTANKKKTMDFCNRMISSGMALPWACSARIDTLDEELILKMRESGLFSIFLGVESGSARMQKLIKKNLDLTKIEEITSLLVRNGIRTEASFMHGFPEETAEDFNKTFALILRLMKNGVRIEGAHLCSIIPGTEMFDRFKDRLSPGDHTSSLSDKFVYHKRLKPILEHRELFAQFCHYDSPHTDRVRYFNILVNSIQKYPFFYYYAASLFQDNLIEMQDLFQRANLDSFTDRERSSDYLYGENIIRYTEAFIEAQDDRPYAGLLRDVFRYVLDAMAVRDMRGVMKTVRRYPFDPQAVAEQRPPDECAGCISTVEFSSEGGGFRARVIETKPARG